MKEIYKDIPEYKGIYQVSNLGNIKSVARSYTNSKGKTYNIKERILKLTISNGYYSVTLNNKGKKRFTVHRLVALAFIENPSNKDEVNHIDGNKLNNCYKNLEWCTKSENTLHAYRTGLMTPNNTKG